MDIFHPMMEILNLMYTQDIDSLGSEGLPRCPSLLPIKKALRIFFSKPFLVPLLPFTL